MQIIKNPHTFGCSSCIIFPSLLAPELSHTSVKLSLFALRFYEWNITEFGLSTCSPLRQIITQPKSQQHVKMLPFLNEKHNVPVLVRVFTSLSQSLLPSLSRLSRFISEHDSHTLRHTRQVSPAPPQAWANHNAAAAVQAELLRLIPTNGWVS